MKSKRMKKLLMAKGISRDAANMIQKIHIWGEDGIPWTNTEKAERFFPVVEEKGAAKC